MIFVDLRTPDKEIGSLLDGIAARLGSKKEAMHTIGEIVRTSINRNFRAQGRPDAWKKSRRAESDGGMTLSLTGRLRNSFTVEADNDSASVGTNVAYATTLHFGAAKGSFGTVVAGVRSHVRRLASGKEAKVSAHPRLVTIPFGNIPARPFMLVQPDDWKEIRDALIDHIAGK